MLVSLIDIDFVCLFFPCSFVLKCVNLFITCLNKKLTKFKHKKVLFLCAHDSLWSLCYMQAKACSGLRVLPPSVEELNNPTVLFTVDVGSGFI